MIAGNDRRIVKLHYSGKSHAESDSQRRRLSRRRSRCRLGSAPPTHAVVCSSQCTPGPMDPSTLWGWHLNRKLCHLVSVAPDHLTLHSLKNGSVRTHVTELVRLRIPACVESGREQPCCGAQSPRMGTSYPENSHPENPALAPQASSVDTMDRT